MKTKLMKFGSKNLMKLKKWSPEIMVGAGVVGVVGTVVLACKSTLQVESILDEHQEKLNKIAVTVNNEEITEYTEEVANQDRLKLKIQTGVSLAKLYSPAALLGTLSVASILTGTRVLRKRNIAVTAAYGLVQTAYDQYRAKVKEDLGELKDREYAYGVTHEEISHKYKDEDGKTKTAKLVKEELSGGTNILAGYSPYSRIFDELNPNWVSNGDLNRYFIRMNETYFNDILKVRKNVMLNEVYDKLGFPRTQAGAVVGWIYTPDKEISFGYLNNDSAFVNGYNSSVILDFNVDGVIDDKIGELI